MPRRLSPSTGSRVPIRRPASTPTSGKRRPAANRKSVSYPSRRRSRPSTPRRRLTRPARSAISATTARAACRATARTAVMAVTVVTAAATAATAATEDGNDGATPAVLDVHEPRGLAAVLGDDARAWRIRLLHRGAAAPQFGATDAAVAPSPRRGAQMIIAAWFFLLGSGVYCVLE